MAVLNRSAMAALIKALIKSGTRYQLVSATGLSYSTIERYLRVFHRLEVVVIDRWVQNDTMRWVAAYRLKTDPADRDAAKPAPLTDAEVCARYRAKKTKRKLGVWGI